MNKGIIITGLSALLLSSCVTLGKYEELELKNTQLRREFNTTQSELSELRDENAELQRQNQALTAEITDLNDSKTQLSEANKNLQQEMANMKLGYDTVIENYNQRITGQSQDLNRANNLLAARTKELNDRTQELNDRTKELSDKEAAFEAKETALKAKQAEIEQKEANTRKALEAKEKELEQLRTSLNNALVGFADKGLNVETRDGKVYVSMESKLLFPSGSWTVSKEGIDALKSLAKVLEESKDLNILVEGHTDNSPLKGATAVKDNWDLSVMRATSIVKLLLQYGPTIDPARIEACGHGEFAPKVPNDSPANKALNRRTEIILTPKIADILNLIGE